MLWTQQVKIMIKLYEHELYKRTKVVSFSAKSDHNCNFVGRIFGGSFKRPSHIYIFENCIE